MAMEVDSAPVASRDELGDAASRRSSALSTASSSQDVQRRDSTATEASVRHTESSEYLSRPAGRLSTTAGNRSWENHLEPVSRPDPFSRLRLTGFLMVHLVSFGAQIFLIVNFCITQDSNSVCGLMVLFTFSGLFCSHAAWHAEAPGWAPRALPLKRQCKCVGLLLMLPLGFLQGIIVVLALEDFTSKQRKGRGERERTTTEAGSPSSFKSNRPASNKFHCKAVVGLFEGLGSAGICLYAYWTMDYPPPVTPAMALGSAVTSVNNSWSAYSACQSGYSALGLGGFDIDLLGPSAEQEAELDDLLCDHYGCKARCWGSDCKVTALCAEMVSLTSGVTARVVGSDGWTQYSTCPIGHPAVVGVAALDLMEKGQKVYALRCDDKGCQARCKSSDLDCAITASCATRAIAQSGTEVRGAKNRWSAYSTCPDGYAVSGLARLEILDQTGTNEHLNDLLCDDHGCKARCWGSDCLVQSRCFMKVRAITSSRWHHEALCIAISCLILSMSAGLGLLELDFCVSRFVAKRMKRSLTSEFLHISFRTSEVSIRMVLYIWFTVSLRQGSWWWVPLTADIAVTALLVVIFGGAEKTWLVRVLCSFPCMFANIFLFIDSPYKRRAAKRLSFWLTVRNVFSLFGLPVLGILYGRHTNDSIVDEWQGHGFMIAIVAGMVPIYIFLLWFLAVRQDGTYAIPDIYSACHQGRAEVVKSAIQKLTNSAAVGLNMNCADVDGWTPLMLAAGGGHTEVCELLMKEGAKAELRMFEDNRCTRRIFFKPKRRRWTAVHLAAARNHLEVLRVIVEADSGRIPSEVSPWRDTRGDTPLHVAAAAGHAEVARLLALRRPAWVDELNDRNERPVDLATQHPAVVAALQAAASEGQDDSPTRGASREAIRASAPQVNDAWQAIDFHIAKTSVEEEMIAPGLCSYIASSCGGALGRVFLANAPRVHQGGGDSTDSVISEGSSASLISNSQLPVVSVAGAPPGGSFYNTESKFAMDDLEPIDSQGLSIDRWQRAGIERRQNALNAQSSSRSLSNIPYEAVLGEGSYGIVWRAQDKNTHTWYAVKTIKTWQGAAPAQATRECEVADRVRVIPHPCIVKLFHVHNFSDAGIYAMVMEFAVGGDLLSQIDKKKKQLTEQRQPYQPPRPAYKWVGQVFLGLEHMHLRMSTLLRDLKPENVVLDGHGIAKLTDFGFGRFGVESTGIWSFGMPTGSPGYVSPEILRQGTYDFRCDLYSFGVLVWVLLTGGLVTIANPMPPIGRMTHNRDYAAHFGDCRMLAQCIADPEHHSARRLKEVPRDFVAKMTHELASQRMGHQEIRNHAFFQPLQLPPYTAPPAAVDAYLRDQRISLAETRGGGTPQTR